MSIFKGTVEQFREAYPGMDIIVNSKGVITVHDEPKKPSKYRSRKTTVDNFVFHSAREAKHYQTLKIMEKAGKISCLELQPEFVFSINGKKMFSYFGDFRYLDLEDGKVKIVDAKGFRTPVYKLKRKIVEAHFGIEIMEV